MLYSYYYREDSNEVNSKEPIKKKFSDASYTIQYPPHEADFLREVEEMDASRAAEKKLTPAELQLMSPRFVANPLFITLFHFSLHIVFN